MNIIPIAFSFFFFIFGAVFSDPTTRHLCRPEQRDTLLEFKNEFKIGNCSSYYFNYPGDPQGTGHPTTQSWTNNSDCCNWEGITCNAKLGEVIKIRLNSSCLYGQFQSNSSFSRLQNLHSLTTLDLSDNHLIGSIPSLIGKLSHLTTLILYANKFSGPLPSSIGNLSHLTDLYLSFNQFSGPLPSFIGNLSHLTHLYLSYNQFSGPLPSSIGNLSHLTNLDLSFNQFSGPLPSFIGKLSHLTTLILYANKFSGPLPSSIGNLSHLTHVNLSSNQFSGPLPSSIGNLSHLTYLYLSSNQFSGPIPSSIGNLSHLTDLYLSSNQFSGPLPSFIGNLSHLTDLYLSSNQFSGPIPSSIGNLSHLTSYDISNNKLEGHVPSWLWTLPNLNYLELSNNTFISFERSSKHGQSSIKIASRMEHFFGSNNNFTGKIPSFICALNSLITLDLSGNNFNGLIPSCIGNLKSTLSDFNLRRNRLSGGLPEDIFESLRSLDVGHNQLVGKLPRSWIHFSSLEVLNVESNKINDTFPFWLSSLTKLKILVLRSNLFHGPIHQALFHDLQIIDISHNHFNGTLSSDHFLKWKAMSSLGENANLTQRKYMGDVYYEDSIVLMNKGVEMEFRHILKLYTAIDFSGNKFEGEIPRSIGILKELHVLNLSNNAFRGNIPSSMANLIALESLDISQNKLSGEIPQELGNLSYIEYMNFSHNQLSGLVPGGTQFKTQPCSSFEDNKGLFGPSLDEACRNIQTPISKKTVEGEEEEEEEVLSWKAVVIGFGPGLVFGLTIGYILGFPHKCEWFMKRLR